MTEPTTAAIDLLDFIDGIVDDTHPEGDGCPLCGALDDMRAVLMRAEDARATAEAQVEKLAGALTIAVKQALDAEAQVAELRAALNAMLRTFGASGGLTVIAARQVLAATKDTEHD